MVYKCERKIHNIIKNECLHFSFTNYQFKDFFLTYFVNISYKLKDIRLYKYMGIFQEIGKC